MTQFEQYAAQLSFDVDTEETSQDYKIYANLKEYQPKDISIEILNQGLQIKAQNEEAQSIKNSKTGTSHKTRATKKTERFVQVPFTFRNEDVNAQYENGMLIISVKKTDGTQTNPVVPINVVTENNAGKDAGDLEE
jgi:HSP20 family molecular chaperone IbpA